MKRATFTIGLALAAGFTSTAQAEVQMVGSDTILLVMNDLVEQCPDEGYDTENDGDLEIDYVGSGSGNAESAMERDSGERSGSGARHQLGPMSRPLEFTTPAGGATDACVQNSVTRTDVTVSGGGTDLGWPAVRPAHIIIGRDDIMNIAAPSLHTVSLDSGDPAGLTASGDGDGTPDDWGADLRTLYFGINDALYAGAGSNPATSPTADCASAARAALADDLNIYHIYRRDDASGTTAEWKQFLGVNGAQPFCNAPGVNAVNTDESQNDKADRDPIRVPCDSGEDVCSCDGTLGLVLPILVPSEANDLDVLYPTTACGTAMNLVFSQLDTAGNAVTKNSRNGRYTDTGDRCPGGASRLGASGCIWWETPAGNANCIHPNVDQAVGLALNASLIAGSSGLCPQPNAAPTPAQENAGLDNDIRSANLTVRNADGAVVNASTSAAVVDFEGRAFYRIHMTSGSTTSMGSVQCQEVNATRQIGCLVARDDANGKVSLGIAGLEAIDAAGSVDYGLSVDGVDSAKVVAACIGDPCTSAAQCNCGSGMACTGGQCVAGVYPFARKLYVNVLSYYDPTDTFRINPAVPEPAAPNGASGVQNNIYSGADEADLLACVLNEVNDLVAEVVVDDHNFLPRLPTDPLIEPSCPIP